MNTYKRILLALTVILSLQACDKQTAQTTPKSSSYAQLKTLALDTQKPVDIGSMQQAGKVVVVNFWATSCATCKKEMPKMVEMFSQYHPKGVEYVSVAMQYDEPQIVKNYAAANKLPFQLVWDEKGEFANTFGDIIGTPTTYIINKQGQTKKYIGEPDWPQFYADLDRALAS
jgi:thiol-disulfide isomerase/thioredoxin